MPGIRSGANNGNAGVSRKLQLVTDLDDRKQPSGGNPGSISASAYVPPVGHGYSQQPGQQQRGVNDHDDHAFTATGSWDQKERILSGRASNPNLHYAYAQQGSTGQGIPNVPPIPTQFLNQPGIGVQARLGVNTPGQGQPTLGGAQSQAFMASPIDVPTLIATKGYNPSNFEIRPAFVSPVLMLCNLRTEFIFS